VSEQLAVKTDDDWRRGQVERVIRTLTPRELDGGKKSSWAHYSVNDAPPTSEALADPLLATRALQALFLFFRSELHKKPTDGSRSSVKGVSVLRKAITECEITDDQQPHFIAGYESSHRSLTLDNPDRIERTAKEILAKQASESWRYSRVDMANLLRHLLNSNSIAPDMEADARSVLAQWDAAS
jgi:hypothetical protein